MKQNWYILRIHLIMGFVLGTTVAVFAQGRPHYNLYNLYQPAVNPAAMGGFDGFSAALFGNYQMIGFEGAPLHFMAGVTVPVGRGNAITGGQISLDRIGARHHVFVTGSFAYRIRLNQKHYFAFGVNASLQYLDFNTAGLYNPDPADPVFNAQVIQRWAPDFSLGAFYFSNRVYAGFSVANMVNIRLHDNMEVNPSEMHFYLHGGYRFPVHKHWELQPSVWMKLAPNAPVQLDVNAMALYKETWGIGLSYRSLSTLVVQTYVRFIRKLTIGYAFNMGMGFSDRTDFSGHELVIVYRPAGSLKDKRNALPKF